MAFCRVATVTATERGAAAADFAAGRAAALGSAETGRAAPGLAAPDWAAPDWAAADDAATAERGCAVAVTAETETGSPAACTAPVPDSVTCAVPEGHAVFGACQDDCGWALV